MNHARVIAVPPDPAAAGRHGDRDEQMAGTAACSGLRRGELAALADSGWQTPAPGDPPLTGVLRASPGRLAEHEADFITSREWLPETALAPAVPFPAVATGFGTFSSAHVARRCLERAVGEVEHDYSPATLAGRATSAHGPYRAVAWRAILARMARRFAWVPKRPAAFYADNQNATPGNGRHLAGPTAKAA